MCKIFISSPYQRNICYYQSLFKGKDVKLKIFIAMLLSVLSSSKLIADDISVPKFGGVNKPIESYFSALKPSNLIQYDNNTGALNTSFSIPLKNNSKDLRKDLRFSYSTYSSINTGFGIGFSLGLPRFYKNLNPVRANYIFEYKNKIVEYQVGKNRAYEKDLTFFSSLSQDENHFIIDIPSGERLTFSKSTGNILREESAFRAAWIEYSWFKNGHLKEIKLYNNSKITFNYDQCNFELKYYKDIYKYKYSYKGKTVDASLCANSVNINGTEIQFNYIDGHLTKAFWSKGNDFPLFSAVYGEELKDTDDEYSVHGKPSEDTTALRLGAYGVKFIDNTKLLKRFGLSSPDSEISFETNASFGFLKELDINHDGLSDFIIEKIDHEAGVRIQEGILRVGGVSPLGDYVYRQSDDDNARVPRFTKKEIYIALGRLTEDKKDLQFYVDPNINIPQSFNTISPACLFTIDLYSSKAIVEKCNDPSMSYWDKHDDEHAFQYDEPSTNYKAVLLKNSSLLVGDFNGDNNFDLLYCSNNSKSIIYSSVSGMEEEQKVDFPCTSQSIAHDINQDGLSDLVTTNGVYLNLNGKFEKVESELVSPLISALKDQLKLQNFSTMSEGALKKIKGNKTNAALYKEHLDKIEDKKITFNALENTYRYDKKGNDNSVVTRLSLESGSYHFLEGSSKGEYLPKGARKRIQKITNALGATTEIEYLKKGAIPLVLKVKKYNLDEVVEENLNFYQVILDKLSGNLLGYKFLRSVTPSSSNVEGHEKIIHFYSDSSKEELLKRTPIHGKVAESVICKIDSCEKLVNFIKKPVSNELPLNEAESFNLYKWNVIYGVDLGTSFMPDQFLKSNYFHKNATKTRIMDQEVFNSVDRKTTMSDYTTYGPLKVVNEKKTGVESSSFGANIPETSIYERVETVSSIFSNVLLKKSINKFDKYGSTVPIAQTVYSYENNYGEDNFKVIQDVLVNKDYSEKSSITLDQFGREKKAVSSRGKIKQTAYGENELKVIKSDDDKEIIENYSNLYEIKSVQEYIKGDDHPYSKLQYNYRSPYVVDKIILNNESLDIDYTFKDSLMLSFEIVKNEKLQKSIFKELDHLGNTILAKQTVDGVESLISKNLFDAHGNLVEDYLGQHNSLNEIKRYEYKYDFMNRLINKFDNVTKKNESWEYDNSKRYYVNDKLISTKEIHPAKLISHIERGDSKKISVEDSFSSGIGALFFEDVNLSYNRNSDGAIANVVSHDLYKIYNVKKGLFEVVFDDISKVKINVNDNIDLIENYNNTYSFSYDLRSRLESLKTNTYTVNVAYDEDDNISVQEFNVDKLDTFYREEYDYNHQNLVRDSNLTVKNISTPLKYSYEGLSVSKIQGLIDHIDYDSSGAIKSIVYTSGLEVKHSRDQLGQLESIEVIKNDSSVFKESYQRNSDNLIYQMNNNINKDLNDNIITYNYSNDLRFLGATKIGDKTIARDEFYTQKTNDLISYKTKIMQIDNNQINYGLKSQINGVISQSQSHSIEFLSEDLHFARGKFVKYIKVNGTIIGAIIFSDEQSLFYPIITDVRGSVRLVYNKDNELVLMKNYDAWGFLDRQNYISHEDIDQYILFDYAMLMRLEFNSDYLFAKHRVYNSKSGRWLTLDPLLLDSVETLLDNRYYEIDGLSYAANDPINFVDPSGQSAEAIFIEHTTAQLGNLAHAMKYELMSAYKYVSTFVTEQTITGLGGKVSTPSAFKPFSGSFRMGYDRIKGPEAFGEVGYKYGTVGGSGQFGYSNGGLRAIGRFGVYQGKVGVDYTLGTSQYARGKFDVGPIGFQYNSTGFGRLDYTFGNFYGAKIGGYFNFQLSPAAYNGFNQAASYSDWAYQGVPYPNY